MYGLLNEGKGLWTRDWCVCAFVVPWTLKAELDSEHVMSAHAVVLSPQHAPHWKLPAMGGCWRL